MSVDPRGPGLPAPAPALGAPVLPAPSVPAPSAAAPSIAAPSIAAPSSSKPNWKPIQRSKARKAINGLIGVAVLAALVAGAWFAYQGLAPAEDTTTPTTLLIDNPDTFVGQANAVVNEVNEQGPEQELLDLAGIETPATTP